jgi:hypothetical protein
MAIPVRRTGPVSLRPAPPHVQRLELYAERISIVRPLPIAEEIAVTYLSAARINADSCVLRVPRTDKATQRNLWDRRRNWYDDFAHEIFNI